MLGFVLEVVRTILFSCKERLQACKVIFGDVRAVVGKQVAFFYPFSEGILVPENAVVVGILLYSILFKI